MIEWKDQAVVLASQPFGEQDCILELFTREHGRARGLVRGGNSLRQRTTLQIGNLLEVRWRARLEDQLGSFRVEALDMIGCRLLSLPHCILVLSAISSTLVLCLAERDPHPSLFVTTVRYLGTLSQENDLKTYGTWELALLQEVGHGLDFSRGLLAGPNDFPAYVSPRTGRVIGYGAAEHWRDRLWSLPKALVENRCAYNYRELNEILELTERIMTHHVFTQRCDLPYGSRILRRFVCQLLS